MARRTVLFVDDERITLARVQRLVKAEDYRPIFAASGSQALEIMDSEKVDVLVTDLMMPGMDGMTLLDWVQAEYPETIRVMMTTVSDTEHLLEAINRGSVYRYIVKPWNNEEYLVTVRQAVEMYALQEDRSRLLGQLENANLVLRGRIQQRTSQVIDLYNKAEIGKYAAEIVHNLNNPLQAIFGALDLSQIAMEQDPPDNELLTKMHDRITKSADSLRKIIRTILLHSKDRALIHNEPVDINGLIEDELEFFKLNATFKNKVEKNIKLDKSLPAVYGSSIQIKQILDNLVKNAIDAMEETEEKGLTILTSHDKEWVSIEISDTGTGIEKKLLEKIFLPDYSTKPHDKGTGLGLASVRSMVAAYDGTVTVQSKPGKGATFTVRLPAYHPEEEETTEPDPS